MRQVKVAVLGAGSWGTTVAALSARNVDTVLWARDETVVDEINDKHQNSRYLAGYPLPRRLRATASLEEAVVQADVLVTAIPSHGMRGVLEACADYVRPWIPIISLTKGIEQGTRLRMTQVIDELLPGHPTGLLAGPNLAAEIMAGYAAAAVIALPDEQVAASLQKVFASPRFRVYTNTDVVGCELGGALKNVIAIAAGMGTGLGVGDNTKAMVITRGLAELTRLGEALGGDPRTFSGLTGLGDLMATCMSPYSRNRMVGEKLALGMTTEQIVAEMNMVAEGIKTSGVVVELAEECGVAVPICQEVYGVLHLGHSPVQAYRGLRRTAATSEIDGLA
ncbi:NAD(P)H-dependent glycerol-3-phosphate dehydrogenase [Sporichthya sp.]|uniref:NAD(P)H-dependent glycerol-3-phosphate dehydrogenase n=1 Tax=Sporichthya sp. TaxID=65475 RepID=UPI001844359D|nr:NAD(P)H-dependent glycerol-3-phosphate dehydrogenase [Sporichthya sp.]MBA3745457.1 NAD(P)H-dependent glycerol-3-phosphate dehydrogenase [Sporichthya sp.]